MLDTNEGPIIVEVKNLSKKVDKETVIKTATVAQDIGARGAIVVSASGFTRDAERVAKALKVELLHLDSILEQVEIASIPGDALFLEKVIGEREAVKAASRLAARKLLFLKREKPVLEECIYHPLYYISARFMVGREPRYRDVNLVASAVSGLPLVLRRGRIEEALGELSGFSPDMLRLYSELAGKVVSKAEVVARIGESRWRRFYSLAKASGLVEPRSRRPLIVEVKDILPGIGELEALADIVLSRSSRTPSRGCRMEEPRVSPGSVGSFIEASLGGSVYKYVFLYAPFYRLRLVSGDSSYRIVWITGWLDKPIPAMLPF